MSDRAARLDELRRYVNLNLARGVFSDTELEVVDVDGHAPVVVALDEERLEVVLRRIQNAGGYANVFVAGAEHIRRASFIDARSAVTEAGADTLTGDLRPSGQTTIGMFLDYTEMHPEGVILPMSLAPDGVHKPVARIVPELTGAG